MCVRRPIARAYSAIDQGAAMRRVTKSRAVWAKIFVLLQTFSPFLTAALPASQPSAPLARLRTLSSDIQQTATARPPAASLPSPALRGAILPGQPPLARATMTVAEQDPPACAPPRSIVGENLLAGAPPTQWNVNGSGDPTIQGFATDISVNRCETINFKINTPATAYHIDIYRMGYYAGQGARKVDTISPLVTLPQAQPACLSDATTGLVDCGNWATSASWTVPSDLPSGIYFARPVRDDVPPPAASHIFFVVRDDTGHSDILVQTSDTTWQAYNRYGGNSLYFGNPPIGRAHKVSYNRPFDTRGQN